MPGVHRNFFSFGPGDLAMSGGRRYKITRVISSDSVVGEDLETKETKRLRIPTLTRPPKEDGAASPPAVAKEPPDCTDEEWAVAQQRLEAIKPLLENPIRRRLDAEEIGKKHGVNAVTLYRWMKRFQDAGSVMGLMPSKSGRKRGTTMLTKELEVIIEAAIQDVYLHKQRRRPEAVIDEVKRCCRLAHVVPPSANSIRRRIAAIHPREVMHRQGRKSHAKNCYDPIKGKFPDAPFPLAVVEIDHTPVDLIVVDEFNRKPLGRPNMTVAIDVFSRMVVGIYLSLDNVSAISAGSCLAQAMCTKDDYLREIDVKGDWPVWGTINILYSDNALEFRGEMLSVGCDIYDITRQYRPPGEPKYGGHVERVIKTINHEIQKLPGTTFSNPKQREGYDSKAESALTLRELERYVVDFIINTYHQRMHTELNMSPRAKWRLGIEGDDKTPGTGRTWPFPEDPLRVRLDFMPIERRIVQRGGIQIDNVHYYDPALNRYINAMDPDNPTEKREFMIRRDPRNISVVYFLDPEDERYIPIPYRDKSLPAISVWELRAAAAELKKLGEKDIDEARLFASAERRRSLIADAKDETVRRRRHLRRNPQEERLRPPTRVAEPVMRAIPSPASTSAAGNDDPIVPFDDIR